MIFANYRQEELEQICDGDVQCLYDGAAMGSLEIGEATKEAHRYYRLLHESMKSGKNSLFFLIKFYLNLKF